MKYTQNFHNRRTELVSYIGPWLMTEEMRQREVKEIAQLIERHLYPYRYYPGCLVYALQWRTFKLMLDEFPIHRASFVKDICVPRK